MTEKVQLTLTGCQRDDAGGETSSELKAVAEYSFRNGSHFILYEETAEGGIVSKNILKLRGGVLELTKKGAVNTRMVFQEGTAHRTDYATPWGCLKLDVLTHSVTHSFRDNTRRIQAEYTLLSEGTPLSRCTIAILLQPLPPDVSTDQR